MFPAKMKAVRVYIKLVTIRILFIVIGVSRKKSKRRCR